MDQSQRKLVLIKFEPDEVFFQHKDTRTIYRYRNSNEETDPYGHFQHHLLLRGIPFNRGVLYQKEDSSLLLEIQQRKRCFKVEYFSEEEILNTFQPLFSCLLSLHRQQIIHGAISLENIVIVEGEVKLRDWLASPAITNSKGDKRDADFYDMGRCLLNCTFLTISDCSPAEWQHLLLGKIDAFSKTFVILLLIFIRKMQTYYQHTLSLLAGQQKHIDLKLNQIYDDLRNNDKKSAKSKAEGEKNGQIKSIITLSPMKKPLPTQKRIVHYQNIENKGEGEGHSKKLQKIRVCDKNASVHELMNKKLNQEEKIAKQQTLKRVKHKTSIITLYNFGMENNSKKISFNEYNSPMQKLRGYSKKK